MVKNKIFRNLPGVKTGILLKKFTTYKIGGPAKYFFVAKNKEDLLKALRFAKKLKISVLVLGNGSNILFSDNGFKGLVIKMQIVDCKFQDNKAFVGAGLSLAKLAYMTLEKNLSGIEWAVGIPGTIGGAVFGHAQAFDQKISDVIESVEVLDLKTLELKTFSKKQCQFALKTSIFKNPPAGGKNFIIISATLKLKKANKKIIEEKIKQGLSYRKENHPISFPSAGSVFVNPDIPAGRLIAECGLKGKTIGKAQISEKHANFIINLGGAKAKDVLALIDLAKKEVKKKFNIKLEPEIRLIGF